MQGKLLLPLCYFSREKRADVVPGISNHGFPDENSRVFMLNTQRIQPNTKKNDKASFLSKSHNTFNEVFHRILDFKSGAHVYAALFFILT